MQTTEAAPLLISRHCAPFAVELSQRPVRIFKPAKTANSSGKSGTSFWKVDWDILQGSGRWENPLSASKKRFFYPRKLK